MLTVVRFSRITAIITLTLLLIPIIQIALPVFASPATTQAPLVGSLERHLSTLAHSAPGSLRLLAGVTRRDG